MTDLAAPAQETHPLEGIEAATLYWHLFCHCKSYKISFCGRPVAAPQKAVGGAGDGGAGTHPIREWDGLGEFCGLCVAAVGKTCPWGCSCGECRALAPRSRWWRLWEPRVTPFK